MVKFAVVVIWVRMGQWVGRSRMDARRPDRSHEIVMYRERQKETAAGHFRGKVDRTSN